MNKLIKKIVAIGTTLTMAVLLLGPALPVRAETAEEIEELVARVKELEAQIKDVTALLAEAKSGVAIEGVPADFTFDEGLGLGSSGDAVKYLQIVLNADEDTQLAESGVGSAGEETEYFGPLTKAAVITFQELYSEDVLDPWGLTSGTGFVGETTRDKLNFLLAAAEEEEEEKAASEITDPTECVTAEYEWYDEACHEKEVEKKAASEITDAVECVTAEYEWYGDACHEVGEEVVAAESITDPIECVTSGYEWYSDSCHEVGFERGLLTVTRAVEPRSQVIAIGGDAIPALGIELEAENNEVTVTSIELKVYTTISDGMTLITDNDEVSAISVYDGDRVVVAQPISDDVDPDGIVGFYGLEEKIAEDTTKTWVIKVYIVEDEDLAAEYRVAVAVSGIGYIEPLSDVERAGEGASGINATGTARYITVQPLSKDIGALKVSKNTDLNPKDRSVQVGEDGEEEVTALAFDVEETNENEAVTITNLNITATSSEDLDISLYVDDTYVDEISVLSVGATAVAAAFEDIDIEIPAGESKTFELKVDFPGIDDDSTYTVVVDLVAFGEDDLTSDVYEEVDETIVVTGTFPISGSTLTAYQSLIYPKISDVWVIAEGEKITESLKNTKMMSFTVTAIGGDINWGDWGIVAADTYKSTRDGVPQGVYNDLIKILDVTDGEKIDVISASDRASTGGEARGAAVSDYEAADLDYYYGTGINPDGTPNTTSSVTIAEGESKDFVVYVDGGLLTKSATSTEIDLSGTTAEWTLENNHFAVIIVAIMGTEAWAPNSWFPEPMPCSLDEGWNTMVTGEVIFNYVAPE